MKNIFLITKREYLTQVRKKSFVVLTLLAPLLLAAFGAFVTYMVAGNHGDFHFQVVDNSGVISKKLKSHDNISYLFFNGKNGKDKNGTDGVLVIPADEGNFNSVTTKTQILADKTVSQEAIELISKDLTEIIRNEKIVKLGINPQQINDLETPVKISTINTQSKDKSENKEMYGVKSALSMLLMYATFMFIMIYGVRVMRSVLEEKNNRVVEILISSVKPFELMMGKILGVTFVALTQFIVWIGISIAAARVFNAGFGANSASGMTSLGTISQLLASVSHHLLALDYPLILFVFILYFFLGYLFYSSIYAAIGSAVDNDTETQQFTIFAMIPLMIAMYGSFAVIKNPESSLAFWLSVVPLTSPVTMVARIPFGVPTWQIIVSLVSLILSVLLMVFIASKVYRIGILSYGNKASLKEIIKWVRQ